MNKRDQALRYLEAGEDPEDVAASLGMSSAVVHEIERARLAATPPATDKPPLPKRPVPRSLQAATMIRELTEAARIARLTQARWPC